MLFTATTLIANLVAYAAFAVLLHSLDARDLAEVGKASGLLWLAIAITAVSAFIGVAGAGLGFAGLIRLRRAGDELGGAHARAVREGAIDAGISAGLFVVYSALSFSWGEAFGAPAASSDLGAIPAILDRMYGSLLLTSTLALFGSLVAANGMLCLIGRLMTQEGLSRRNRFLFLSLAGPLLNEVVALVLPSMVGAASLGPGLANDLAEFRNLVNTLSVLAIAPAIGNLLTVRALGHYGAMIQSAVEGARNQLSSGPGARDMVASPGSSWERSSRDEEE